MISVKFSMFIDRPGVLSRIAKKQRKVLGQTGAFGRTVMRRSIRPPKASKKARTITVGRIQSQGRQVIVPVRGRVVDAQTGRPVSTAQAAEARKLMARKLRREGRGQPPRRGRTDLLRQHIYFGVDPHSESVVIGPLQFAKQPVMVGAGSVPELLEFGGQEKVGAFWVKYDPHPFVRPALDPTLERMQRLIERVPL